MMSVLKKIHKICLAYVSCMDLSVIVHVVNEGFVAKSETNSFHCISEQNQKYGFRSLEIKHTSYFFIVQHSVSLEAALIVSKWRFMDFFNLVCSNLKFSVCSSRCLGVFQCKFSICRVESVFRTNSVATLSVTSPICIILLANRVLNQRRQRVQINDTISGCNIFANYPKNVSLDEVTSLK